MNKIMWELTETPLLVFIQRIMCLASVDTWKITSWGIYTSVILWTWTLSYFILHTTHLSWYTLMEVAEINFCSQYRMGRYEYNQGSWLNIINHRLIHDKCLVGCYNYRYGDLGTLSWSRRPILWHFLQSPCGGIQILQEPTKVASGNHWVPAVRAPHFIRNPGISKSDIEVSE